jgi:hypothetical protein
MAFQIIPADGTIDTNDRNWQNLQHSTQAGTWNPVPSSGAPAISGTGLLIQAYFVQQYQGIILFNITASVTSGNITLSWANNNYWVLPRQFQSFSNSTVNFPFTTYKIVAPTVGTDVGNLCLALNGKNAVLINKTGAPITSNTAPILSIQGFYFTGK